MSTDRSRGRPQISEVPARSKACLRPHEKGLSMSQSARAVAIAIEKHAIPFDENGFVDWLIDASPGDKVVYYRGHLGHDRMPSAKVLERKPRAALHAVAIRVMVTAAQGLVLPVQKRVGPEEWLYIAVKAQPGRLCTARRTAPPMAISLNSNSSDPATIPLAA